jgi:ATP/maltotriose-dependent transcriptional regulator MalT
MRGVLAHEGRRAGEAFRPVERPRVLERLQQATRYRVAVIIAPAGFGKSIALRQYLEHECNVVRYDVPPDATSLASFVRALVEALGEIAPAAHATLGSALEGADATDDPSAHLASWLALHIPSRPLLLAIDDLHIADQDERVSEFVRRLVERTAEDVRWIFASRTPSGLPIPSWIIYGILERTVTEADLQLSIDEARALAHQASIALTPVEVSELLDKV